MKHKKKKIIVDEMSQMIIDTTEQILSEEGLTSINVSTILKKLNITNRVFYNRFSNIEEVLEKVYFKASLKIRETMTPEYDGTQDFFDYAVDLVVSILEAAYELKNRFNLFMFASDSISESNYNWYVNKIKQIFDFAKANNQIVDVDSEIISYVLWCACRGFNADAVMRMEREEAIRITKYSFKYFLRGIKK